MTRLSYAVVLGAVLVGVAMCALDAKDPLWEDSKRATPLAAGVTCTVAPLNVNNASASTPTTFNGTAPTYTCASEEACCESGETRFCCPKKYELACGCESGVCYSCLTDGDCLDGMKHVCFSALGFIVAIVIVAFLVVIVAIIVGAIARLIYVKVKRNKS